MLNINNNILESFKTVNSFNLNDLIIEAKRLFTSYSDIKVINKTQSFEENTWVFEDLISADSPYKFDFNSFIPLISFNKKVDTKQFILALDRKSTRLNSSHVAISYAVFCLQKKNTYSHL